MEDIILVGFGGHAKSVIDSIESEGKYRIVGYTDFSANTDYRGYKWLGADEKLSYYYEKGIRNVVISVGYLGKGNVREKLYDLVKHIGYNLPVIIDPTAIISKNITIEEGTFIGKHAIINAGSKIGKMCIINSGVIIEHENVIEDFSHIAVGAVLCGNVKIGKCSFVGANATVIQDKVIGQNCIIGASEILKRNLESNNMYNGAKSFLRGGIN